MVSTPLLISGEGKEGEGIVTGVKRARRKLVDEGTGIEQPAREVCLILQGFNPWL